MESIAPVALLVALVYGVINFLRMLRGRDWNGAITQLAVWVAGVVGVFLFAETDFADAVIPGTPMTFESANGWSLLFIGLTFGASATVIRELVSAIDANGSTVKPPLLARRSDPQ